MATWGGRLAVVAALSAALAPVSLTAGCAGSIDQAHSVQTKLGRVDGVVEVEVTAATPDHGARIGVVFTPELAPRDVLVLVRAIAEVASEEDYPSYRLDLREAESEQDLLVVDDSFDESPRAREVVDTWQRVGDALLGDVTFVFEPGSESISVDAGGAFLHDIAEASRIRYGHPQTTTWQFTVDPSVFVLDGRVTATDLLLAQRVQRTVASPNLVVPASTWRLERRADHVLLDLRPDFVDGPVPPRDLSVSRYGEDLELLVETAVDAVHVTSRPIWLRLRQETPAGDDVFAWWVSDQRPVRGRDPLGRGWDGWLRSLGDAVLAGDRPGSG